MYLARMARQELTELHIKKYSLGLIALSARQQPDNLNQFYGVDSYSEWCDLHNLPRSTMSEALLLATRYIIEWDMGKYTRQSATNGEWWYALAELDDRLKTLSLDNAIKLARHFSDSDKEQWQAFMGDNEHLDPAAFNAAVREVCQVARPDEQPGQIMSANDVMGAFWEWVYENHLPLNGTVPVTVQFRVAGDKVTIELKWN